MSGSGGATPCRNDSVPMMWDTTARTHQPGSGVIASHPLSGSPSSCASMASHTAKRPSRVLDLSTVVIGRVAMLGS